MADNFHTESEFIEKLCDKVLFWSENSTGIDDNRHFRSTFVPKIYCAKRCALKFDGSPCEQFFDDMTTSQDIDEIHVLGTKVLTKFYLVKN